MKNNTDTYPIEIGKYYRSKNGDTMVKLVKITHDERFTSTDGDELTCVQVDVTRVPFRKVNYYQRKSFIRKFRPWK